MDQSTITVITAIAAAAVTGWFTLRASFGAQKRAAYLAEKHREDDLKLAEKKAQLRAVADYLRAVAKLHSDWRNKQTPQLLNFVPPEAMKNAALDAVNARNAYLSALQSEADTLHLYVHNKKVDQEIAKVFTLIGNQFAMLKVDYERFPNSNDPNLFGLVRRNAFNGYDRDFDSHFRKCHLAISRVSRLEFGKQEIPEFTGLYTPPSGFDRLSTSSDRIT